MESGEVGGDHIETRQDVAIARALLIIIRGRRVDDFLHGGTGRPGYEANL